MRWPSGHSQCNGTATWNCWAVISNIYQIHSDSKLEDKQDPTSFTACPNCPIYKINIDIDSNIMQHPFVYTRAVRVSVWATRLGLPILSTERSRSAPPHFPPKVARPFSTHPPFHTHSPRCCREWYQGRVDVLVILRWLEKMWKASMFGELRFYRNFNAQ